MAKLRVVESVSCVLRITERGERHEKRVAPSGVVAHSSVRIAELLVSAVKEGMPDAALRWIAPVVSVTRLEGGEHCSEDVRAVDIVTRVFGDLPASAVFTVKDRWPDTLFVHLEAASQNVSTRVFRLTIADRRVTAIHLVPARSRQR